jgi:hypothetical protein
VRRICLETNLMRLRLRTLHSRATPVLICACPRNVWTPVPSLDCFGRVTWASRQHPLYWGYTDLPMGAIVASTMKTQRFDFNAERDSQTTLREQYGLGISPHIYIGLRSLLALPCPQTLDEQRDFRMAAPGDRIPMCELPHARGEPTLNVHFCK